MKAPIIKPKVKLVGVDGNAFNLLGIAATELRRAGADKEYIDMVIKKATSSDYEHLIATIAKGFDLLDEDYEVEI